MKILMNGIYSEVYVNEKRCDHFIGVLEDLIYPAPSEIFNAINSMIEYIQSETEWYGSHVSIEIESDTVEIYHAGCEEKYNGLSLSKKNMLQFLRGVRSNIPQVSAHELEELLNEKGLEFEIGDIPIEYIPPMDS